MYSQSQRTLLSIFDTEDIKNPITLQSVAERMDAEEKTIAEDLEELKALAHDCHAGPESGCEVCPQREFVEEELID